ncbi:MULTISPECIES: WcbI family polysaccharide biosynthesis putative acetyltransferase [unclassified Beijerinckia]|uniref:WcbI family polysaccharide biosynthesis putative acetyltransferase n=1 Tax=unclassified Beijerinckia TaxID=2638183 RepID=UPI00089461AF|nr:MULTISPECIES: WcbI family polysaccharide biosynthesis putative acetyltransferase [unclassified Beijerinckia]MDH7793962.1 hypothetical protein [Beijerinckia sp. GAS462]SEB50361.1 hypothetical protein SAMN05443249_0226 [Beijerinckia sp. 28-YEA-48]
MLSAFDRNVLSKRVRQVTGRNRRKSNGPHIAVIANCQTFGVAYAMDMLLPGATVDPIQILLGNRTTPELLAKVLRDYDYVFGLKYISTHLRFGDHTTLERLMPSIRWFPLFHFPAYHPDFLFLQKPGSPSAVLGLFNFSQSAILSTAFRLGLSQKQALSLMNEEMYARLGYFDVWQSAWDEMLRLGRECDLDYGPDMIRWSRAGSFMHTPVHPKAHVMYDVARMLLRKEGLTLREGDFDRFAVDRLVDDAVLPIYPPIAKRLGVKGDYVFKRASHPGPKNRAYFYSLEDFVASSYETFSKADPSNMQHPRIDGWLQSPEICDLFRSRAKG